MASQKNCVQKKVEQNHLRKFKNVINVTVSLYSKQLNKDFSFIIKTGRQAPKSLENTI